MTPQPYRIPAERDDPYAAAWSRLRRRRLFRRLIFGFTGYAFATVLVFAFKSASFDGRLDPTNWPVLGCGLALGVVFLVVAFALARYLVPFVCPRCEQPFFRGLTTEIGFTKDCVNCGLTVGTPRCVGEESRSS